MIGPSSTEQVASVESKRSHSVSASDCGFGAAKSGGLRMRRTDGSGGAADCGAARIAAVRSGRIRDDGDRDRAAVTSSERNAAVRMSVQPFVGVDAEDVHAQREDGAFEVRVGLTRRLRCERLRRETTEKI